MWSPAIGIFAAPCVAQTTSAPTSVRWSINSIEIAPNSRFMVTKSNQAWARWRKLQSTGWYSARLVMIQSLRYPNAIHDEPDRQRDQRRLAVLNAMTAPRRLDMNAVARLTEPFVVERAPDDMPACGAIHVGRRLVGAHAREHRDRNVG